MSTTPPLEPKVVGEVLLVHRSLIRAFVGQPRTKSYDPEKLQALADSMKQEGQKEALTVRRLAEGNGHLFELIGGERRWRASEIAGIQELRVIVSTAGNPVDQYVEAVLLNCNREDISTLETAEAIKHLKETCNKSVADIKRIFGKKSDLWVYSHLKLFKLHPGVLTLLGPETDEQKRLAMNTALLLTDLPHEQQIGLAMLASETGLSALQLSHLIKNQLAASGVQKKNRSSEEFDSLLKFLRKTNERIEILVDYDDARIAQLLHGRASGDLTELDRLLSDCFDNLSVVKKTIEAQRPK